MKNLITKNIDINLIKNCMAMALIYCLLFNSAVIINKYSLSKASFLLYFTTISKDFFYMFLFNSIIFFGLSINKILFKTSTVFLFITGATASYYLYYFGINSNARYISILFSTNISEMYDIISVKYILWLAFSLFVCVYAMSHFKIEPSSMFVSKILSAICILVFLNVIISPPFKLFKNYFPSQYLHYGYNYITGN